MKNKTLNKTNIILISALVGIIVFLICTCAYLILAKEETPVLSPDIAPSSTDKYSEPMNDGSQGTIETPTGGGAASLAYTKKVTIDLSSEKASMMFGNPSKSNQNLIIQVIIQETVISQSGLIEPGNKVTTLELLPKIKNSLSEGVYSGKYLVFAYDRETGEKEKVVMEIPITINVQK